MKLIDRIVKVKRLFEQPSGKAVAGKTRSYFRSQSRAIYIRNTSWLVSAFLMAVVAYYTAEQLSALHIVERMRNIIDLDNGNFTAFEAWALKDLSGRGYFEPWTPELRPSLLSETYWIMGYGTLLFIFGVGLCALVGVYKVFHWVHARHYSLQAEFRKALKKDELSVHYQPIVNLKSGLWCGAEALLRWNNGGRKISPSTFIPFIEQSGLMPLATRWVCRRVIEDYSRLFWACDNLYISINLSAQDVLDPSFPNFIEELLAEYKLPALHFVFEVTEGVMLNKDEASVQLNRLRAQGHRIALDDFGTGYSCLSYLACLPLDLLKIDRSFLTSKGGTPTNIVLSHMVSLARLLGLCVIVEGVESTAQVEWLKALGVDTAQGWFYSKELAPDELVRGYFSLAHPTMNNVI